MSRAPDDRGQRWPSDSLLTTLILFLILLVGGGLLYLAALNSQLAARQDLQRETERLRLARDDLRQLPQRLALAQAAEADFRRMARRGFFGDGDRLDWVSALARVGRQMGLREGATDSGAGPGLDSLTWQLEPRQPHATLPDLWVTPMTLRAAPLTPAGLGELLRRLAEEAHGLFSVDSCQLTLAGAADDSSAGQVECRLLWWNWRGATRVDPADTPHD